MHRFITDLYHIIPRIHSKSHVVSASKSKKWEHIICAVIIKDLGHHSTDHIREQYVVYRSLWIHWQYNDGTAVTRSAIIFYINWSYKPLLTLIRIIILLNDLIILKKQTLLWLIQPTYYKEDSVTTKWVSGKLNGIKCDAIMQKVLIKRRIIYCMKKKTRNHNDPDYLCSERWEKINAYNLYRSKKHMTLICDVNIVRLYIISLFCRYELGTWWIK